MSAGWLVWIIAMIVAVVVIFVTFRFNLQKWVIIIATAILGTGVTIGTFHDALLPRLSDSSRIRSRWLCRSSWLLMLLAIVMAVAGIVVQYRQNKSFTLDSYNKWEEPA